MFAEKFLSILFKNLHLKTNDFLQARSLSHAEVRDFVQFRKNMTSEEWKESVRQAGQHLLELEPYHVIYPSHPSYPHEFLNLTEPPVFLSLLGDINLLSKRKITVVGSRRVLPPMVDWMQSEYVRFLKQVDVVTVSGGAFGVDYLATKLSVFSGRASIVILPSGLSESYPRHTREWRGHKQILMISEYFPRESVRRHHFVLRNRLLGSLSPQVFAVQSALKSGTMTTVMAALEQGREVMTLPSFPGVTECSGNIQLIKDGALVVTCALDLQLALGLSLPDPNGKNKENEIGNP